MSTKQQPISKVAIGIAAFVAGLAIAILSANGVTGFVVGQIFGAIVMGMLCGCLPYYQAKKVGNLELAQISLASCTLAGLILGIILALPTAIAFTIVIVSSNSKNK